MLPPFFYPPGYGMMPPMYKKSCKLYCSKGFSLIELAIVLVIVGMLIGLGSGMVGMLSTAIKVRQTKDTLDDNIQAITSYASSNNRIPDTGFATTAKSPQDSWGRDFIYLYDTNLYSASPTKDTICGRRTAALTVSSSDPAATISNVAFVLISKSDDATLQATAIDAAVTVSRAATGTITIDANNSDIVRWVTLDELRSKIGCQGPPLKIVNNELPYGNTAVTYSATISADGGVPFASSPSTYKWCVEINNRTTLPGGLALCSTNTSPCTGTAPLIRYTQSGQYCYDQAETAWTAAFASLYVTSGLVYPTETGSFSMTVYVRDNNNSSTSSVSCNDSSASTDRDSCASKAFVLTMSPTN